MRQKIQLLFGALVVLLIASLSASAQTPASSQNEDTDTKFIDAKVVEVTDSRLSIIARSGVEHVIEINNQGTKVMIEGEEVSLKDLRKDDVITIELDEQNPVMFAKNISLHSTQQQQVARARR